MLRSDRLRSVLVVALVSVACNSEEKIHCENLGNCEQGGSSDFIDNCREATSRLSTEANRAGCGGAFDDYFKCTNDNFECHGATAVFPGCDAKRTTLATCLANATASTSCAALANQTRACSVDAGATELPPACTATRDCEAQCFLTSARNVCAPTVDELAAFRTCAAACP